MSAADARRVEELERLAQPGDRQQAALVGDMKSALHKLQQQRRTEDPRLSFSTPEFKEAQRTFTEGFKASRLADWTKRASDRSRM